MSNERNDAIGAAIALVLTIALVLALALYATHRHREIAEVPPYSVTLAHEDYRSVAEDRFDNPRAASEILPPHTGILYRRDCSLNRWMTYVPPDGQVPASDPSFHAVRASLAGVWNDLALAPDVTVIRTNPARDGIIITGIHAEIPCQDGRLIDLENEGAP